ncbi:PaaI family thioesterase [Pseudomonas putida]|uniref:PaaI family thioesterase n=1 Tax=Pseudomonas putida TaxID=303 RepID=A0A6I6XT18_PSEPU|nr:PaaI family thioesterase [Pseudomonas putida]QHG64528.2 PaaI family thioesterase [Pseudomonas putida]
MNKDNPFWRRVAEDRLSNVTTLLGWFVDTYQERKREIQVRFHASESFTNPLGKVQGGMLAAMLDDCMGPAIYALLDEDEVAVTLRMSTTFLLPASPGPLQGIGTLYRRRGKYCYTKGMLLDGDDRTVATAKACYKILPMPKGITP